MTDTIVNCFLISDDNSNCYLASKYCLDNWKPPN